jgi:hypothetical protein
MLAAPEVLPTFTVPGISHVMAPLALMRLRGFDPVRTRLPAAEPLERGSAFRKAVALRHIERDRCSRVPLDGIS